MLELQAGGGGDWSGRLALTEGAGGGRAQRSGLCPHFTAKEMESQKGSAGCPGPYEKT